MTLDRTYQNSGNRGMVELCYLAIGTDMLVNKSIILENDIETHGGQYDYHIWMQFVDSADGQVMLTALIGFYDEEEWDESLLKSLVDMQIKGMIAEVSNNLMNMFGDALDEAGFVGTRINDDILRIFEECNVNLHFQLGDFQMHVPTKDNPHPGYDT